MSLFPTLGRLQLVVLLGATLVGVATVNADTLIVTNTADAGAGSLRAAIAAANDGDTIQFDAALNGQSILLTSGELVIDTNITIDGPGADQLTVTKSSGTLRIFHVLLGHGVTIEGLTIDGKGTVGAGLWIDHASVTLDGCVVQGCLGSGGVLCSASFNDDSYVIVANSTIRNNQADTAGGGIHNQASNGAHAILSIRNSIVSNNIVGSSDTASGGGIWNSGEMDITNSIVNGNVSGGNGSQVPFGNGGGISNQEGSVMLISNSTISGNSAGLTGGGVYNVGGLATIDSSTVSGNSASGINDLEGWGDGAGIYNGSSITITNSTLSNNNSTRSGGAVSNRGSLTIGHSTLSGNNAFEGGTIANYNGATVQIGNTALKVSTSSPSISNISGTITSNGYNLINDNGGGFLTGPGDQINTEPMLGPLQNNGGPTFTHGLLTGSPAIDTGDPSFTPPPLHDQRGPGYNRVVNGRIDVGAFEVQPAEPTPTPPATATPTATVAATPSPTPTATASPPATPTPTPAAHALQLSTRMFVQTGDNVGIGGFIITGSVPKQVLLRGVGASTVPGALADPVLELHGPPGFITIINDNCDPGDFGSPFCMPGSLDSAIVATLDPGTYSAILRGNNNASGVALVEVYDLNDGVDSKLANLSTRAFVSTGDDIVIAGVLLGGGSGLDTIVVRGIGPSLTGFGVPNALADPMLELRDENGALLVANDNWQDDPIGMISVLGLAPTNALESAIVATLAPGAYTALLSGVNNGTGVGLVEVYDLGGPN